MYIDPNEYGGSLHVLQGGNGSTEQTGHDLRKEVLAPLRLIEVSAWGTQTGWIR